MREKLLLIHGNALAYKSYYSLPSIPQERRERESPVSLFLKIILHLIREHNPSYGICVFDMPAPTLRKKPSFSYHTLHPRMPPSLRKDLEKMKSVAKVMGFQIIEGKEYSAEDIIATVCHQVRERNMEVLIVSPEKDLLQLVSPQVRVINPFQSYKVYEPEQLEKELGIRPSQIPDFLALTGDESLNLPGIQGMGEITARKLLQNYGNLEGIYSHLEEIEKGEILRENRTRLLLSKKIALLNSRVPISWVPEKMKNLKLDLEKGEEIFPEFGLTSSLLSLAPRKENKDVLYHTVLSEKDLEILLKKLKESREISLDTETTSLVPHRTELVGISISLKPKEAYYIPLRHSYLGAPPQLPEGKVLSLLKPLLEEKNIVGQNLKFDYIVLAKRNIRLKNIVFDTMIASHLLNPVRGEHNLEFMAMKYLGYKMKAFGELVKDKKNIGEVDIQTTTRYACEDVDYTLRLKEILLQKLEKLSLLNIFTSIEIPLIPVLAEMEIQGILMEKETLLRLSQDIEEEMGKVSDKVFQLAGEVFNLNSPQQVAYILFEKLRLPPYKKGKTGYSTSVEVLSRLASQHEIARWILEYRNLQKIRHGFILPLISFIDPQTGRIHTSFHQAVTATGRLSSSQPNLQNIPLRGEWGKELRKAFISPPGSLLLSADYSQIELRIMASLSQDETLIETFRRSEDIHTQTAQEIFHLAPHQVTPDLRRKAKAINFGIIYGISPFGLAQQIGCKEEEAKIIIESYFKAHPGVKKFIEKTLTQAREKGYVTTMMGRRRPLPGINSENRLLRNSAEREAINTPVQGTAAEIIKMAMINIYREINKKRLRSKILLQIHDELLLEVPEEEKGEIYPLVKNLMEKVVELKVPLVVNLSFGKNWLEAHGG